MALSIKFHEMVNRGEVQDYADLARLGYGRRNSNTIVVAVSTGIPSSFMGAYFHVATASRGRFLEVRVGRA